MGYDGIDRYEAESIARSCAQDEAYGVKRDLEQEIESLRSELRKLSRKLDQERSERQRAERAYSGLGRGSF